MPNLVNMICCRRSRAAELRDIERTKLENVRIKELMGPRLTTVGRRNKSVTAAMTDICQTHGACGREVVLVMEAVVAFVEFEIQRNYEDILWPTSKQEKKLFEVINAHNESICSGLYRNSIDDYDDPQDAKKIAKLCKKTHRYDFDCVMRERYANLTWAEVTALYSRKLDSKQSRVPDQGMTTGMKVTAVDWVQVCDQVAQILDLTVDQMHSALWYYTDGATAHGLIKSTIMGGQCDLLALKMLKDKPVLMKLYQGPLGKPEHVDMHRRIDLLQKHFFSYITETDYLVKPELQGWAQEKSDDKYSFFRMRRKEIAKAAAEKDYEEERTRDEEWLESVLSSSDEGLEVRDVEGIQ